MSNRLIDLSIFFSIVQTVFIRKMFHRYMKVADWDWFPYLIMSVTGKLG